MDLFAKCKELYEKIRYFEYGIPVDGTIKPVPSSDYFVKNYHFLKPEEFEKYKGGICWDYVEYERKFLEVNDIDFNQYYLITNTPPNYDTHTFVTVKDGDDLIYIESSFKRVEHIIDGVQKFKSLEDIVKLITTNMWECNGNDKRFDEFKYDVCKFKGHPQYGCTCEEYMKWMDDNSDIVIQDVSINPKKVSQEELPVEEFTVNKIDTKFTQFVCESATNDPEEYDEALHDHLEDEDDIYNESWVDFKNGVHPSSGLMFHVSLKNDMDGKTITPQLPSYITDGGKLDDNYQEDTKTKRLCVSPSIEGCMIAILNYKKIREHVGDKFYVYTPEKPFSQYKHKTNKEIVKNKLVFDANITKEAWILEPCKLKLYGIIKLKKVKDLKKKPTVEKNIKMNTIKLDYEWIMTPKASGKFNKAIGDSPDEESDKKEKPIKEYTAIMEGFYDDKAKSHSGGVYGIYDLSDDYSTNFCNIILQGHNTEYLGWNAPKGEELIRKTFEVIRSEEWTFNKSDRKNVIPDYSNIFTYASQILPIIRLDALGEEHIKDLKAPSTLFTVHDPNSDTDIKYLCVIPQVLDVIDKSKTSYVYDEGMDDLFADHIVYNSDLINRLGMFRVKHDHPVAGTYDDNEFFQTIFRGPTISSNLFDIFNNFNSIRLFDISDVSAWDLAVDAEEHYRSDGRKINPGDPDHPYNKSVTESTNVLVSNEEFFMESQKRRDSYLKKIKYDPKTQTADTGILDTKTGKNIRIKIKSINNDGAYYQSARSRLSDFKTENGYDLNKFLENVYINIPRNVLNQKKNAAMATFYHEIGHFLFDLVRYFRDHLKPSDVERLMKWDAEVEKYTASLNEDMVDNLNSHDIDAEEMMADLNATSKVSRHSYNHDFKKYHDQSKNVKGLKKQEKIVNSKIEQAKANKDSKRLFNLYNTKNIVDTQNQALREDATSTKARLKANEELTKRLNESANVLVSNEEFFMEAHKMERRIQVRPESLSDKLYIGIHPSFINTKCKIDDKSLKTLSRFLNSGREIYLTKYPVVAYAWILDKYFISKAKKKKLWDYVATLSEEDLTNEEFDAFDVYPGKLLYIFKGYVLKIDRDDIVDTSQVYKYPEMQHPSMVLVDSLNLDIKDIDKKFSVYKFWSNLSNWNNKMNKGKHMRIEIPSSFKESYDCILMDNDEFFGLSMIQESHKNITKHSFKSLTKKGITVDRNSETGKLVKKVIDNVLKNHSLPSVKLNPSGFGVAKETDTFFYGYPRYIDGEIPTDSKGKQLRFMAQINCKELKSLPDYPHTGLLQFWVHGDSEILDGPVKAIYIEKPNKNNIANVSLDEDLYSYKDPGDFPYIDIKGYNHSDNLLFKSTTEEMIGPNITDLDVLYDIFSEEYKKLTGKKADISALVDYIWDDDRLQPSWGNRVGGYPSSTQETSSKRTKSWNTMLLQLESIDREVYWGDFGIAAFYISHNDLIRKDFSKVGFDWDCY